MQSAENVPPPSYLRDKGWGNTPPPLCTPLGIRNVSPENVQQKGVRVQSLFIERRAIKYTSPPLRVMGWGNFFSPSVRYAPTVECYIRKCPAGFCLQRKHFYAAEAAFTRCTLAVHHVTAGEARGRSTLVLKVTCRWFSSISSELLSRRHDQPAVRQGRLQ